jgi:hypothetical protein
MIRDNKNVPAYLCEADVDGSFPEALTADVEAVLADETSVMCADAAVNRNSVSLVAFSN